MKRVLIAMLLVLALLSTGIASGSYVQAKTQKYWVYDSAQAKVKGNKLVVKAPLYVGEKKIKKKKRNKRNVKRKNKHEKTLPIFSFHI